MEKTCPLQFSTMAIYFCFEIYKFMYRHILGFLVHFALISQNIDDGN
jgi:hypothetical protein